MVRAFVSVTLALLWVLPVGAADGPATRVVIPAAASSSGVQGAYWQTELIVFNPTADTLTAVVEVLPALGDVAPPAATLDLPIPPNGTRVVSDVLGTLFPGVEFGALVVHGIDPDGDSAPVLASSRTWSLSDVTGCGQTLAGLAWPVDDPAVGSARTIDGLISGPYRRTNLGIVNLSDRASVRFGVDLQPVDGGVGAHLDVSLPPRGTRRVTDVIRAAGLADGAYRATIDAVEVLDGAADGVVEFMVYGSVVDRQTGRPATLQVRSAEGPTDAHPAPQKVGIDHDAEPVVRSLMVVGMAADGAARSQLSIENLLPRPTVVRVEIFDRLGFRVGDADLVLAPGAVKDQRSVLTRRGLVGDGYSARVTLVDPVDRDIREALRVSGFRSCGDQSAPVELSVAPMTE
jgi:hypothetical protein